MDVHCVVCGEPWDGYGARHGDMTPWQYDLFRQGAGCPCCEGVTPEGSDPELLAEDATRKQVLDPGTDDDDVTHNYLCVLLTGKRPKWQRPSDPVVWTCHGCHMRVIRDLDSGDIEWERSSAKRYREFDRHDVPESAPFEIDGRGFCPGCATECGECGSAIFHTNVSETGKVLYGDTYDAGASFSDPRDSNSPGLCVECFEALPDDDGGDE
jgi:hypothetical protein